MGVLLEALPVRVAVERHGAVAIETEFAQPDFLA